MAKVSVIIPSRNENYLLNTIRDLYENASGEIEMLVTLDGPQQPKYKFPDYPGLHIYHNDQVKGMRWCINSMVEAAKGKYILKIDAHCSIAEGWDEVLKADCADNWMVVPSRFMWDAPGWTFKRLPDGRISRVDAHYFFYPFIRPYNPRLTSRIWPERAEARKDVLIDEDMCCQGSCWFMQKSLFNRIGGLSEFGYGTFTAEPEELALKISLGPVGGAVMRNKNTWYSHWQKPADLWWNQPADVVGRISDEERVAGNYYCFDFWFNNRWTERVHDFSWYIDKFWPIPTWPSDWREDCKRYTRYEIAELEKWKRYWTGG